AMRYQVPVANAAVGSPLPRPTIVLQRLANPSLPPDNTPTNATYNPYVTIDFVERTAAQSNEGRGFQYDAANFQTTITPPVMTDRLAWGRMQPYDGANDANGRFKQQPAAANQPRNTFFRQNSTEADPTKLVNAPKDGDATLKIPFDWMAHVDRQL